MLNVYKVVMKIHKLINVFFITFIINLFVSIYTIYNLFEIKIFHNEQGSKLKMKADALKEVKEER